MLLYFQCIKIEKDDQMPAKKRKGFSLNNDDLPQPSIIPAIVADSKDASVPPIKARIPNSDNTFR